MKCVKAMFRRLLVPLDGTLESERAVAFASGLARPLGSAISLLEVLPTPPEAVATKSAFVYLQHIARQLASVSPRIDTQVRTGSTADGVLSCVELISADLLVVATSLREVELIVSRTRLPVVVVPKQAHGVTSIKRVLVPVDDLVGVSLALTVAAELACQTGAELDLLRVAARAQLHVNRPIRDIENDPSGGRPRPFSEDLCEAIIEASRQLDPDVMVMDTSEFLKQLPLSLVDAAAVPVLLIPQSGHRFTPYS
jgi:nucleotide-binding universal stress UspA family protein